MKFIFGSLLLMRLLSSAAGNSAGHRSLTPTQVFINEFHYSNKGTDMEEYIEVAFPSGLDLSGYEVELYNGSNGNKYRSVSLANCVEGDDSGGLSFCHVDAIRMQNGGTEGDGLAIVDPQGNVLQFLSYEGTITASAGAAQGMTSTDIGVQENGAPIGYSLQLGGSGCAYEDFAWQSSQEETFGSVNLNQAVTCSLSAPSAAPTDLFGVGDIDVFINEFHYENKGADVEKFIEIAYPAGIDVSSFRVELYNGGNGNMYQSLSLSQATLGVTSFGLSFCYVDAPLIQKGGNGAADGLALVDAFDNVIQFLSYEGVVDARVGAAAGTSSVDIGVNENGAPVGTSLQLGGEGCKYSDFAWQSPRGETAGDVNLGQTVSCPELIEPPPLTDAPTLTPSSGPTNLEPEFPGSLRYTNSCSSASQCKKCEGNCEDNSTYCEPGLVCFSRSGNESVAGCVTGGVGDVSGASYCHESMSNGPVTYVPGEAKAIENELLLSTGLTASLIAIKNEKVKYADGTESVESFHTHPDGGAVFDDPDTGGWIYVSNSESKTSGGVGAITFNADGEVIGYKRILNGTKRNCGGGKTFWGTWMTCEETEEGQVYEVDPWGNAPGRRTIMGGAGDKYESAAYDNRNESNPTFYVTTDSDRGPLVKFTPDVQVVADALAGVTNYSTILHENTTGTARLDYLILEPNPSQTGGNFSWTENLTLARDNAFSYYQKSEGIDIRNGIVFFTCKKYKHLYILDLDNLTYERSSTRSGAFDRSPDQVARILGGDDGILYFCEDGGEVCGVHGRDSSGNFYTILDSIPGGNITGETTGLAFSTDNMHMYVSFQKPGYIYDITRTDGYPFGGQRLDIKYHANDDNLFAFS